MNSELHSSGHLFKGSRLIPQGSPVLPESRSPSTSPGDSPGVVSL